MDKENKHHLDQSLGFIINIIALSMRTALEEALKPFDVSTTQWLVLQGIAESEEAIQTDIGKITHLDNATITRHLDKLESVELLQRTRIENDRRVQMVQLTDKGRELLPKITEVATQINARALKGLNASKIANFIEILHLINDNLTELHGDQLTQE